MTEVGAHLEKLQRASVLRCRMLLEIVVNNDVDLPTAKDIEVSFHLFGESYGLSVEKILSDVTCRVGSLRPACADPRRPTLARTRADFHSYHRATASTVSKAGPSMVYSGDMKASNKDTKFMDDHFPVVELLKNQTVKLEGVARLGKGKNTQNSKQLLLDMNMTQKQNL